MSTLQCPATLLLARAGEPGLLAASLAGRRVAQVWADGDSGAVVAAGLGVGVSPLPEWTDAAAVLDEVADAHPGETVLLVVSEAVLDDVPLACRMTTSAGPLAAGETVEVLADADGRVCVRWG